VELKDLCCEDMPRLQGALAAVGQRLRQKPEIIRACFEKTGY